jgi:hypothetical protein
MEILKGNFKDFEYYKLPFNKIRFMKNIEILKKQFQDLANKDYQFKYKKEKES